MKTALFPSMSAKLKKYTRRSVIATALGSAAWGFGHEPNTLTTTQQEFTLPNWPKALDGFRIAHLTDISSLSECCKQLSKLSASHGIIASPGNHDRWHCRVSQLRSDLNKAGIDYLQNANTTLQIKGERIFLPGLDSIWGGKIDPDRAWKGHRKDDPVLALVHEPDVFDQLHPTHPISLQLSGHTHGGQCRVPLIGYAPKTVRYGRNYVYGDFQKDQAQLWVGRGIGTVGIHVRFACSPELTMIKLHAK